MVAGVTIRHLFEVVRYRSDVFLAAVIGPLVEVPALLALVRAAFSFTAAGSKRIRVLRKKKLFHKVDALYWTINFRCPLLRFAPGGRAFQAYI